MRWIGKKSSSEPQSGPRRPRVKPLWRRPAVIGAVIALLLASAAGGGWWIWRDGLLGRTADTAKWALIAGAARAGFAVDQILVDGRHETSPKRLLKTLRLKRGAPILAFDPAAAKRRLESLPWVRSALVERQLPDIIRLRLMERRPLALWQRNGKFSLIDTEGKVVPNQPIGKFRKLLVVVGEDAPGHAARLLDILASHPRLAKRVRAAVRVGGRRWNLHMDNRVRIRLPEADTAAAWSHLAQLQQRHRILEKDVIAVDLRLPDRVVVRPSKKPQGPADKDEQDT